MAEPLACIRNLTVSLPQGADRPLAVEDVSLDVGRNEIVCIVGESGSGKSVTAHAIMGLLPRGVTAAGGQILFGGVDLLREPPEALRKRRGRDMAMIFQDPMAALNPVVAIGRQVTEQIRAHRAISEHQAMRQAGELLGQMGLKDVAGLLKAYPHQLSGGQRQRVMIAMALSLSPQLLIADEPTTALDVTVQAQILELLRNLSEKSKTALMLITHDLGVVAETCTRMITMYAGEVIEDAAVDAALVRPLHPYTSGLLRSLPHLSPRLGKLPSIPGRVPSITDMPNGCRFKARCPHATAGCEAEQELLDAGDGRKVRCWRFRQLELPGALQQIAAAPIAGMVVRQ